MIACIGLALCLLVCVFQTPPPTPPPTPQAAILDEAHRMKKRDGATRLALEDLSIHWLLLLSGTPVQNSMRELQVRVFACVCVCVGGWVCVWGCVRVFVCK